MKILFKNTNFGFIGVNEDRIDYIGEIAPQEKYDIIKDMSGKYLMPGFYNTHTHSSMTLLRGIGSDLPLHDWLFNHMFPTEDKLRAEDFKTGAELAILEMLSTGTVSFSDMYFNCDRIIEAVAESGIKANICRCVQSLGDSEKYSDNRRAREAREIFERYNNSENGKIKIDYSVHAEYTCCDDVTRGVAEQCLTDGANFQIHLAETENEVKECIERHGKTPVQWFYDLGAFKNPVSAAHCVWVNDDDIAIMKECNVHPVHNPTSNMKLGSGFMPVRKFLEVGLTIGLGTDGASSNNNLNMFEEMHLASIIHDGYNNDPTLLGRDDALKMATRNGALIQGRSDCGEIKVGNKADIIAIDLNKPHLIPNLDSEALMVYSAQGSDVCMTMVDGKILYENGEFLTIDKERIYHDVNAAVKYIYS